MAPTTTASPTTTTSTTTTTRTTTTRTTTVPPTTTTTAPPTTTTRTTTTTAPPTTTPAPKDCMIVNTPCNSSLPQTRHDTDGYYCTQFSNNSFFVKFSCSPSPRYSFEVSVCGEGCMGPCFPDPVTRDKLNLTLYDGLLGGNGSCVSLPGLPEPAQVQCAVTCPPITTTVFTSTAPPTTTAPATTTPTQPCISCLDLCALSDTQPQIAFNCRQSGRELNVSTVIWGCTSVPAALGTTDQTCGDPAAGTQITEWFGRSSLSGCRWQVSNQQVDDSSQFLITWNATRGLADMGVDPVFSFSAILSNPPPSVVEVSLASITNGISTRCLVQIPLAITGPQPQAFSAAFTRSACPAAFNPRSVSRFTMSVVGPVVPGPAVSFQLVSSSSPLPGPCFNGTNIPVTTTAVTTTVGSTTSAPMTTTSVSVTTTPAPLQCLNLTAPCTGSPVRNFDEFGRYCFPMFGPPTSPMLAIAIVCNGSTVTTLTCPTLNCSSGCVENSAWAEVLGLTRVNATGSGECVTTSVMVPGLPNPSRFQCVPGPCQGATTTTTVATTTGAGTTRPSTTPLLTTSSLLTTPPPGLSIELNETNTTDCLSCHFFLNNQGLPALSAYANLMAFGGVITPSSPNFNSSSLCVSFVELPPQTDLYFTVRTTQETKI